MIDPYTACGAQGLTIDTGWKNPTHPQRRARCNRAQGHDGGHVEYRLDSYMPVATFTDVYAPKPRKARRAAQ